MHTTAPNLTTENIRHAFFTRQGGVSTRAFESMNAGLGSADDAAHVAENRRRAAAALGVEAQQLITCYQTHSCDVVTATEAWTAETRPRADAIVTNMPRLAIGVLTADCGPILFADPVAGVIGAAHAGWRGAFGGILENTVKAMRTLGAKPGRIVAAIGPCIGQASYEVGPEFPAPFVALNPDYARFFRPAARDRHFMFDLPGFIAARLRESGITDIAPSPADTMAEPERYFSYRRNQIENKGETGRLLSAIVLK